MGTLRRVGLTVATAGLALLASPLTAAALQGGDQGRRGASFLDLLVRPKPVTMLVIGLVALGLLLGHRMSGRLKVSILLLSTFLYGVAANLPVKLFEGFSMHPSPICAATKSVLYGFRTPMVVTLATILVLTLVGPKLFCGWVCPVGAVQELIAMLADKLGIRRRKLSFRLTNGVRVALVLLFVFLSGTAILHTTTEDGRTVALSSYDYLNAFHGFEIAAQPSLLETVVHFLPFLLTLGLAFALYRPFCYLVCPIGLLTNLVEQIGLFRIVVRRPPCNDCGVCSRRSPCPVVPEILKDAAFRPDCHACTVCLDACPSRALELGTGFKQKEPSRP